MTSVALHSSTSISPRAVLPLSPSTRSLLRSAPLLCSLPQCIAELVENALDASASHIHIVVDCARLSFSVADDGRGMSRDELERCGTRHWTTKSGRRRERGHCVFGARGEALASLADVATVDITSTASRHSSRDERKHASSFSPSLPSSPRQTAPTAHHKRLSASSTSAVTPLRLSSPQSHGTTVAITQLYSNLPVRRRLLLSRRDRERESIKRRLERISLVHRHVVFSVWDDEQKRQLLSKGRLTDLPSGFGELYRYDLAAAFLPVMRLDEEGVGVRLFVSSLTAGGYHTRDYQFAYINRRPVVHPTLQRLINQCWQRCKLFMDGGPTPTMRVVHAVFVLLLELDELSYDCLLQTDKQLVVLADEKAVVDAVRRCLHVGLMEQHPVLREKSAELFGEMDGDESRVRGREAEREWKDASEKENDSSVANGAFIDLTGEITVHLPSRTYLRLADACSVDSTPHSACDTFLSSQARRSLSSFAQPDRSAASSLLPHTFEAATLASALPLADSTPPPPSEPCEASLHMDDMALVDNTHILSIERAERLPALSRGSSHTGHSPQRDSETTRADSAVRLDDAEADANVFPVFDAAHRSAESTPPTRSVKRRRAAMDPMQRRIDKRIGLISAEYDVESTAECRGSQSLASASGNLARNAFQPPPLSSVSTLVSVSAAVSVSRPPVRSLQAALDEGQLKSTTDKGQVGASVLPNAVEGASPASDAAFDCSAHRFLSSRAGRLTFPLHPSAPVCLQSSSPTRPPALVLHKRMLHGARIVGQVDHMYVLCVLDGRHLVAVDQHAADERVRLEDLEAHIAQLVGSQPLPQPLQCQLTSIEAGTLELYRHQVDRWGWRILYSSDQPAHTHTITHCPALLLPPTACLNSAVSLHDYLAQLAHSLRSPSHTQLPEPLLSLLHSRACKSAIRFGDGLSPPQQAALVRALGRCQLPFQCAHGRPSMQPLIDVSERRPRERRQAATEGGGEPLPDWWKEQVRQKLGQLGVVQQLPRTSAAGLIPMASV